MTHRRRIFLGPVLVLLCAAPAAAQRLDYTPPELEGIRIEDRAGAVVPRDVRLRDESGKTVTLGNLLPDDRPALIQLVYFECPMLCNLVINGYLEGAAELDWNPGADYEVLSISFNPEETHELAALKKANYLKAFGRPEAAAGWHFLTGDEAEVRRLADALGFPYRRVEKTGEYAHGAGMFVITPDGRISRTLYGIRFPGQDLRLALMEASEGKLGSPIEHLVLYCFRYDADAGGYVLAALQIMKIGGALTVAALATLLSVLWLRDRRRQIPRTA